MTFMSSKFECTAPDLPNKNLRTNFRNNLNWSNYYKGPNCVVLNCPGSI